MGAVRIYKNLFRDYAGIEFAWSVRSGGCAIQDADYCNYGKEHGGYCNDYTTFRRVVRGLNDPNSRLGAYLKK